MPTRRKFLQTTAATCAATLLPAEAFAKPAPRTDDPMQWVDLHIGLGGHGHCFPAATMPFGAVQLGPDTYNAGWDWCSGYHFSDTSLMGFSHTHLSGTGCGDLLDFLVMAGTGPAKLVPGSREDPDQGYRSRFNHDDEVMVPGYYSVLLKDYSIKAEMTATERAGLHRYTFPKSDQAYLILDLHHSYEWRDRRNTAIVSAELSHPTPTTLAGGHVTNAWGYGRHAYFTLEVSKKPTRVAFYSGDVEVAAPNAPLAGTNLKAVLYFETRDQETILVRTGISAVSAASAARNLANEVPSWDFDRIRQQAHEAWTKQLNKIRISSANPHYRRVFYTSLYHMSLGPGLFDDVDGSYRGADNEVHKLEPGQRNYTTFSCWDTYRAAHPAYTLIEKRRVPDFVNSLIRMSTQSTPSAKRSRMPVWPLWGIETGTMTGFHSASIIAEAVNKGFPGIDVDTAYSAMMKEAMEDDYRGLPLYRQYHYIPADLAPESVSTTFEYCYNDWAIAHVAKKLGHNDIATQLTQRSLNYRNCFDQTRNFVVPKLADGTWASPFTPNMIGHSKQWRDYTESNPWQTTFAVQHDPAGLIALFGGRKPFLTKLDELFTTSSEQPPDAPPDITGLVGQYAQGNEPSHHIAYLYVYAGAPHKTQQRVRMLMDTMYPDAPDGLQGNEDVGQMSAWFLLSALGFYSVDPVSGNFVLGSPLVDYATLDLGDNATLEVEVQRLHPSDQYIQGFSLNGTPQTRAWFNYADIANGGKLTFQMSATPNLHFGAAPGVAPPSLVL
jgi:predicted alpha-1,2-mannosidase